jgi:ribosomal protein S18 acetylase RimI-like enzyme
MCTVREAVTSDAEFLTEIYLLAADWRGTGERSRSSWMDDPAFGRYLGGWKREDDFGLVAELDGTPVGAAWWRFFAPEDESYGFVNRETPELTIAVLPATRGIGIGHALLGGLVASAAERGIHRLSLSVEDGNRARALYEATGFVPVGRNGGSDTLLLTL